MNWYKLAQNLTIQQAMKILNLPEELLHDPNELLDKAQKNYRKLIKIYHPDVNKAKDAEEMSRRLNNSLKIIREYVKNNFTFSPLTVGDVLNFRSREKKKQDTSYFGIRYPLYVRYILDPILSVVNYEDFPYSYEVVFDTRSPLSSVKRVEDNGISYLIEKYGFSWDAFSRELTSKINFIEDALFPEFFGPGELIFMIVALHKIRNNNLTLYDVIEHLKKVFQEYWLYKDKEIEKILQ